MRLQCSMSSMVEPQTWISSTPACTSVSRPSRSVDVDQLLAVAVLDAVDALAGEARGGVLLEEALPVDAFRAAHQRERAVDQMRRDVVPDRGVVVGELLLGDAGVGPVDAVGMA